MKKLIKSKNEEGKKLKCREWYMSNGEGCNFFRYPFGRNLGLFKKGTMEYRGYKGRLDVKLGR